MREVRSVIRKVALSLFLVAPQLLLAQQVELQFNVTYTCPDGKTYVIHRCEKGPKFEYCYYLENPTLERINIRSQVDNRFRTSKVTGTSSAAAQAAGQTSLGLQMNTPYQYPGGLVLTLFQC